ncbi:hypothetical protein CBL_04063, partial [Carabus blaptoides fortunei]
MLALQFQYNTVLNTEKLKHLHSPVIPVPGNATTYRELKKTIKIRKLLEPSGINPCT